MDKLTYLLLLFEASSFYNLYNPLKDAAKTKYISTDVAGALIAYSRIAASELATTSKITILPIEINLLDIQADKDWAGIFQIAVENGFVVR